MIKLQVVCVNVRKNLWRENMQLHKEWEERALSVCALHFYLNL